MSGLLVIRPHAREAEEVQHARGDAVEPLVGLEAQTLVGLEGVEALVLQAVGAQLVHQPDAAAFLREIEQHAAARLARWRAIGAAQLIAAIAFERAQKIAGEAFRMQRAPAPAGTPPGLADEDGIVFRPAVRRAEGDELGILGAFERHVRARHDAQASRAAFGVEARRCRPAR